MKVKDLMTSRVIRIDPMESAAVAARTLAHYNIGALPVCDFRGNLEGIVTDRDLVTRCLAAGRDPAKTRVRELMTMGVVSVSPDTEISAAAAKMGHEQVRRLPVVENGQLCGMVSLGDLAECEDAAQSAGDALTEISDNMIRR